MYTLLFIVVIMMVNGLLFVCVLMPILARFVPGICVMLWLSYKGKISVSESLRLEIQDLKDQQSEISVTDEFAKHAKISRQINAKNKTLKSLEQQQLWIRLTVYWYSRIALYLFSALLVFWFRAEPVVVMDIHPFQDYVLIYSIAYILAFPTGIPGAVGLPLGMFVIHRMVNKLFDMVEGSPKVPVSDPVD